MDRLSKESKIINKALKPFLILLVVLVTPINAKATVNKNEEVIGDHVVDGDNHVFKANSKDGRLLTNPFGILGHKKCSTRVYDRGLSGVCFNEVECLLRGGAFKEYCDPNILEGVCCVFIVNRCDDAVARERVSYYTNPSYPAKDTKPHACMMKVQPLPNVCWVRFDLIDFSLHSNAAGTCDLDTITILNSPDGTGGRFCGEKANFATVVRTDPKKGLDVAAVTQSNGYRWNIRVTQIDCDTRLKFTNDPDCGNRGNASDNTLRTISRNNNNDSNVNNNDNNNLSNRSRNDEAAPRVLGGVRRRRRRRRRKQRPRAKRSTKNGKKKDKYAQSSVSLSEKLGKSMGPLPSPLLKKKLSSELFFPSFTSRDLFCKSKFRSDDEKPTSKIIDGTESNVNAYPWMVSLQFENEHFCGGSLITSQHVITAAHCMEFGSVPIDMNNDIIVVLGDHDLTVNNETESIARNVRKVTFYPSWFNDPGAAGDMALLTLDRKVEMGGNVGTVCLPQNERETYEMMTGLAVGWGITETGDVSPVLREVMVNILSNSSCVATLSSLSISVQADMICTFGGPQGTETICSGDSGGPLMIMDPLTGKFVLVGATSFSVSDCTAPFPAVFSRITYFLEWISAVLASEKSL